MEILQYCKNIYKAVKKVSKILQEPCNVRSKHKWNIAVMWELSSSLYDVFKNKLYQKWSLDF